MKVGDVLIVSIEGMAVCEAFVEAIEDGRATVVIPATRAVFGINMSLAELAPEVDRQLSETVERPERKPASPYTVDNPEPVSLRDLDLDSSAIDDKEEK